MTQMVRMSWYGMLVHKVIEEAAEEGAEYAATQILDDAQEHVPLDYGTLKDTGMVTTDGTEAFISYDTDYAVRLHEHPEYNFQGQGEGKWLENAFNRHEERAVANMALPLRKVMSPR